MVMRSATFSRPRRRVQVEFVVAAQRVDDRARFVRERGRVDAEEVLGDRRAPLGQADGGERRPAGFQGVVEHVAVGEVLDQEAVGIAPVVEELAALDVAADAPGAEIAVLAQVFAARGQRVEVAHLVGRVHVAVGRAQRQRQGVVVGGVEPRSQRMKLITGPRSRWPG